MAKGSIFISYGHRDMTPIHWVDRLKLYFAPLRQKEPVHIWDDSKIGVGRNYRKAIKSALDQATFAILIVGPAFLKSSFIMKEELPPLLEGAERGKVKVYPLVVKRCRYRQSILEPYRAYNDLKKPLQSLKAKDRNEILNKLCIRVDKDFKRARAKNATRRNAGLLRCLGGAFSQTDSGSRSQVSEVHQTHSMQGGLSQSGPWLCKNGPLHLIRTV
jgi:hypothetical protein